MNSIEMKEFTDLIGGTEDKALFKVRLRSITKDNDALNMLWLIYRIAKDTDVFTDDVKDIIFNKKTYKEVEDKYGITSSNLKNNIFRQMKKYSRILGSELYSDVKTNNITSQECTYISEDLLEVYKDMNKSSSSISSLFYVDLITDYTHSTEDEEIFTKIDDDDFKFARDCFVKLSIPATHFMIENLDDSLKKYIAYLITTPEQRLTEKDILRKQKLSQFLKIDLT